ncbi:MAG: hypothetical protein HZB66_00205 [Candidatus Aenigmarchaeota archaeon]|nr:hypothetical protein [Candidatus Aenigmarchaeota archaeon]
MATQIDFIVAAGVFILITGFVLFFTTDYLETIRTSVKIAELRSDAMSLLSLADRDFEYAPQTTRIGLHSYAYRLWILVNNTQENLVNQSLAPIRLENELVTFSYAQLGFGSVDYNSTAVYENGTHEIARQVSGNTVSFSTAIDASEEKWFLVYFDDDSNFTRSSDNVSGSSNITEKIFPVYKISLVQYKKIQTVESLGYESLRNTTGAKNFRITITDISDSQNILDFGGTVPKEANVVALDRRVIFQNETGGIRSGDLIVKIW